MLYTEHQNYFPPKSRKVIKENLIFFRCFVILQIDCILTYISKYKKFIRYWVEFFLSGNMLTKTNCQNSIL